MTNEELIYKLRRHRNMQAELASLVSQERELRDEIANAIFPRDKRKKGVNNFNFSDGSKIIGQFNLSYKLNNKEGATVAVIDKITVLGPAETVTAAKIVKWEPVLSFSTYRDASSAVRELIDTVLTITDAAPILTYVRPQAQAAD